jgi:hypothetical protein
MKLSENRQAKFEFVYIDISLLAYVTFSKRYVLLLDIFNRKYESDFRIFFLVLHYLGTVNVRLGL